MCRLWFGVHCRWVQRLWRHLCSRQLSYAPCLRLQLSRPPSNPPISELARPELKLAGALRGWPMPLRLPCALPCTVFTLPLPLPS